MVLPSTTPSVLGFIRPFKHQTVLVVPCTSALHCGYLPTCLGGRFLGDSSALTRVPMFQMKPDPRSAVSWCTALQASAVQ